MDRKAIEILVSRKALRAAPSGVRRTRFWPARCSRLTKTSHAAAFWTSSKNQTRAEGRRASASIQGCTGTCSGPDPHAPRTHIAAASPRIVHLMSDSTLPGYARHGLCFV